MYVIIWAKNNKPAVVVATRVIMPPATLLERKSGLVLTKASNRFIPPMIVVARVVVENDVEREERFPNGLQQRAKKDPPSRKTSRRANCSEEVFPSLLEEFCAYYSSIYF